MVIRKLIALISTISLLQIGGCTTKNDNTSSNQNTGIVEAEKLVVAEDIMSFVKSPTMLSLSGVNIEVGAATVNAYKIAQSIFNGDVASFSAATPTAKFYSLPVLEELLQHTYSDVYNVDEQIVSAHTGADPDAVLADGADVQLMTFKTASDKEITIRYFTNAETSTMLPAGFPARSCCIAVPSGIESVQINGITLTDTCTYAGHPAGYTYYEAILPTRYNASFCLSKETKFSNMGTATSVSGEVYTFDWISWDILNELWNEEGIHSSHVLSLAVSTTDEQAEELCVQLQNQCNGALVTMWRAYQSVVDVKGITDKSLKDDGAWSIFDALSCDISQYASYDVLGYDGRPAAWYTLSNMLYGGGPFSRNYWSDAHIADNGWVHKLALSSNVRDERAGVSYGAPAVMYQGTLPDGSSCYSALTYVWGSNAAFHAGFTSDDDATLVWQEETDILIQFTFTVKDNKLLLIDCFGHGGFPSICPLLTK